MRKVVAIIVVIAIFAIVCDLDQQHQWPVAPPTGVAEKAGDVVLHSASLVGNSPVVRMVVVPREEIGGARGAAEFIADEWERDGWDVEVGGRDPAIVWARQDGFEYVAELTTCTTITSCRRNPAGSVYVHVYRVE